MSAGEMRPGEGRVVLLAGLYFFCLLAAYYALRPMRDSFGAENPYQLHWLFTGTLAGTLVAQPIYGRLVSRRGRAAFIPISYRFLILNALLFGALLGNLEGEPLRWAHRAYFVWLSVFAVFGVTVFWGFLADIMGSERAKRLYGYIAIGGTLGAWTGSSLAGFWLEYLESLATAVGLSGWASANVLLPVMSALLLECAVRAARAVEATPLPPEDDDPEGDADAPVGGGALDGFRDVVRSPYLGGICLYVAIWVFGSTMLYFITSVVVGDEFADSEERTRFFARMDMAFNGVALVFQVFLTSKLLRRAGIGLSLAVVPLVGALGFGAIALSPGLLALGALFVARRGLEFGLSKPARETLFTVMTRDEKYKAKAVVDTVVYRGGDAAAMWLQAGLTGLGFGAIGFAWGMVPICVLGVVVSLGLGRMHARKSAVLRHRERG